MNSRSFIDLCNKYNICITSEIVEKLELYKNKLIEENNKYNLTAITEQNDLYIIAERSGKVKSKRVE